MTRLSLKNSIFMGFGSILVLLGLLAFMALRGTNTIGHDFTEYRQAARESLLVNAANDALLHARLEVMQYRVTNDAQSAAEVERYLADLSEFKAQLIAFTTDPQRAAAVNQLDESVRAYQDAFARVVELQTTRNTLAPQLNQTGRAARSAISQIIETSDQAGNAQATYLAGLVQQHLMLARYYGERFLLENATSDQERTLSEIGLANTSASLLGAAIETRDARALFDTYTSNVDAFASLFAQVSDVIIARNAILADELDQIGPQLAQGYASILTAVVETQNTVGPRASAEVASVSRTTMMIAAVALAFGLIVAFFIGRMLTRSISSVVARMKQLAEGQLDITIDGTQRKDELGDMARALLVFQDNGREKIRLEAEQVAQAQEAEAEKRRSMHAMADGFEATVNEVVAGVSSAAQQMVGLAQTMSDAARRANERSSAVAAASEEASTNVETVAAASEEMTNSIAEVSERIGQSASMTDEAARGAERTTQTVSKLATSAQTIGDVISMISAIAEQTNLLALNATIEAARAGEAGKGFAVVASEVKSLANQTAKATEQISAQITTMQGDTDAVVEAIDKIGTMIQDLNSTSASIAAAVEEQHSATQEIARNTQQAADGTREVSANITEVSMAVQETGQAASDVLAASSQLASEADRLRDNVAQFLNKVRAA